MIDWTYDSDADPVGGRYEEEPCYIHPWNDEPYPCWECEEDWNEEEDEPWEDQWDDGRISY